MREVRKVDERSNWPLACLVERDIIVESSSMAGSKQSEVVAMEKGY
jgi:hypothetical protein